MNDENEAMDKLFNELKSQGISLSKNTLYEYIDYLREVYAIFTIPLYSRSVGEQNRNPLKLYAIDNKSINIIPLWKWLIDQ